MIDTELMEYVTSEVVSGLNRYFKKHIKEEYATVNIEIGTEDDSIIFVVTDTEWKDKPTVVFKLLIGSKSEVVLTEACNLNKLVPLFGLRLLTNESALSDFEKMFSHCLKDNTVRALVVRFFAVRKFLWEGNKV